VQAAESQAVAPASGTAHGTGVRRIEASPWLVPVDAAYLRRDRDLFRFIVLMDLMAR
jgi:hypothetical protein